LNEHPKDEIDEQQELDQTVVENQEQDSSTSAEGDKERLPESESMDQNPSVDDMNDASSNNENSESSELNELPAEEQVIASEDSATENAVEQEEIQTENEPAVELDGSTETEVNTDAADAVDAEKMEAAEGEEAADAVPTEKKEKPKAKKKKRKKKSTVKVEDIILPIEALCFVSENSVKVKDIVVALENALGFKTDEEVVHEALDQITEKYKDDKYPFELTAISDGYRFLTKQAYHKIISSYLNVKSKRRLSSAAMETLSIIAYKQPITKSQIEDIRGVSCDYSIQKLLEKELITILGRSEAVGRPLLYGTSQFFMDYFGLKSINELPQLKEVVPQDNQIGIADEDIIEHFKLDGALPPPVVTPEEDGTEGAEGDDSEEKSESETEAPAVMQIEEEDSTETVETTADNESTISEQEKARGEETKIEADISEWISVEEGAIPEKETPEGTTETGQELESGTTGGVAEEEGSADGSEVERDEPASETGDGEAGEVEPISETADEAIEQTRDEDGEDSETGDGEDSDHSEDGGQSGSIENFDGGPDEIVGDTESGEEPPVD